MSVRTLRIARTRRARAAAAAPAGTLGFSSKMPGTAYGIPAAACHVGAKLHNVPDSVCSHCYALKGRYIFHSVQQSQQRRLASLEDPRWPDAMVKMLRQAHGLVDGRVHPKITDPLWHRWHNSGDVQSLAHLRNIALVCLATPEIKHWLPSREAQIVALYLKTYSTFPPNLCVRISATMIDGAPSKAFPNTSTVHRDSQPQGHVCPAPQQGGVCGGCRACWSRDVRNTSYHVH